MRKSTTKPRSRKPAAPAAPGPSAPPPLDADITPFSRKASTATVNDLVGSPQAEVVIDTPIGPLLLVADERSLCGVFFPNHPDGAVLRDGAPTPHPDPGAIEHPILRETARQLAHYFAGKLRDFDLPLDTGGTEFQQSVWKKLCDIPYATTINYGALATSVGNPNASRAVGAANGKNPIPVIIPCHRVIGANGSLTGFGGGEPTKRWLLDHEARVAGLRLF